MQKGGLDPTVQITCSEKSGTIYDYFQAILREVNELLN